MDLGDSVSWNSPGIDTRVEFLRRMQTLANQSLSSTEEMEKGVEQVIPLDEVDGLLNENRITEAFFLARRMAAEGVEGAIDKVEEIRGML